MATVTTLAKAEAGKGNPGRKPYFVEVEIDLAAAATAKGSALAANDIIEAITVGANTLIMTAGMEITVAPAGGNAASVDLGITGGDVDAFVDGFTLTGGSVGDYGTPKLATSPILVTTSDTIDMLLLGTTPDTSGKVRVYAWLLDVDSIGTSKAADEVDRDTLA